VYLASDETTGENDFRFERAPNVCAVVIERGTGSGWVQIIGGGKTEIVRTNCEDKEFVIVDIAAGQSCMLYGTPTVLYIYPKRA
jgi:hypothetical protein